MKKTFALAMMATMLIFALVGCGHEHIWEEATCTAPKTCADCGATEGEALGHVAETWTVVKEPTCSEEGIEMSICSVCQEEVEREIATTLHTLGGWKIVVTPTKEEEGLRVNPCTVCGEEVVKESFSLTAEELEAFYKENCESISYGDLERFPGENEGKLVKFRGKVAQICYEAYSSSSYSAYRVSTQKNEYGEWWDDIVFLLVDNYDSGVRILEDDMITFYGTYDGLYTYTAVSGAPITIPQVTAEYFEFK